MKTNKKTLLYKKTFFQKLGTFIKPLFLSIVMILLFNSFASGLIITSVEIVSVTPSSLIPCNSWMTVNVDVRYRKQVGEGNGYIYRYLHIIDFTWGFFRNSHNLIASDHPLLVEPSDPDNGVVSHSIQIACFSTCQLCGNVSCSSHGNPYEIYARVQAVVSERRRVECVIFIPPYGPNGKAYVIPQAPVIPGGTVPVKVELALSIPVVTNISLITKYDNSLFTIANASFDPAFISLLDLHSYSINTSTPGIVRFTGHFINPQTLPEGTQMGTINLTAHNNSPFGDYLIQVDTSSRFLNSSGNPMDLALGSQLISIVPNDTAGPVINTSNLIRTDTSIIGLPGAITDNYGNISEYLEASLYLDDSSNIGYSMVNSDGSFVITNHFISGGPLILIARDGVGNESEYNFPIPLNLSVAPDQNQINILKSTNITISFGADMNASTINSSNIKVFGSQTGKLLSSISYNATTKTATINPNNNFKVGEKIQVTLSNGVQTSSNTPIVPFTWTFTVQALSGTGGFVEASVDTSGTNVSSFASGDFDNDGDLDIITLNINSNYFSIYKNNQLGNFTKTSPFPLNVSPKSIIEGDFDSDGDLDIAIAGNNVLYIYKNSANAVFSEYTNIQLTGGNTLTSYADVGDLDKDGDIDIFWGAVSGDFIPEPKGFIFLNNGNGSFNYPQSITFGAGFSPCVGGYYTADVKKIEIVDFDNDGDLDVAASAIQGKECIGPSISYPFIAILFNNGNSQFSRAPYISLSSFSPLTTGNFDNDEDADIISKNLLLKNNNNGSFVSSSNNINGTSLISSDFDADGDLDVAAANTPNKLFVHKNSGNAAFTQPTDLNLGNNPLALESGDFDGDGDIDMVMLSGSGNFLSILKNNFSSIVNLTALIEGFYDPVSNTQVGDTINLYLGNFNSPYQIVDSAKAFLNLSGNAILNFNNAASGLYYLVFKHRNSIETWSNGALQLTRGGVVYHDFAWAQYQAFGGNMKLKGTRWCIYSGDVNQDGTVDLADGSLIDNDSYIFATGYVKTDLNGDNFVDVTDATLADNNIYNFVSKITPLTAGPQASIDKDNAKKNQYDQRKNKEVDLKTEGKNKK